MDVAVELGHVRGGAAVEVIEADDGRLQQQHGQQRPLQAQALVHGATDAEQAGIGPGTQPHFAGLAVEKAHFTEHFAGLDLADFHFAFGHLRHQAAMALEHEEQGFADLADVGDDLALLGGHQVAVVQEIVNLAAQQDAGVDQVAQELGQVFAVFGGNGQTFHDAGLSELWFSAASLGHPACIDAAVAPAIVAISWFRAAGLAPPGTLHSVHEIAAQTAQQHVDGNGGKDQTHELLRRAHDRVAHPLEQSLGHQQQAAGDDDGGRQRGHPGPHLARLARGQQQHGGERRRSGKQGHGKRKDHGFAPVAAAEDFGRGGEDHLDRHQQQDHATGHLQRRLAQAHQAQETLPAPHEAQQHDIGDADLAQRHRQAALHRQLPHDGDEERQIAEWVQNQQQQDEGRPEVVLRHGGSTPRVMVGMQLLEALARDMGVDLRGGDVGVSKQELDHAQVGAMVEQMGGEGVAQGVRRQRRVDARVQGVALEQGPEHLPRHAGRHALVRLAAALGDEQEIAVAAAQNQRPGLLRIAPQPEGRLLAERHQPVLAALAADDAHHRIRKAEMHGLERHQFAHAQAAGVDEFEHGAVPQPERGFQVWRQQQGLDLGLAQGLGPARLLARALELERGVVAAPVLTQRPAEIAPQRGEPAVGRSSLAARETGGEIGHDVGLRGLQQARPSGMRQPAREQAEIAAVSGQGVGGQAVFQPQRVAEPVDRLGTCGRRRGPFGVRRGAAAPCCRRAFGPRHRRFIACRGAHRARVHTSAWPRMGPRVTPSPPRVAAASA